jgi:hypothetical protein
VGIQENIGSADQATTDLFLTLATIEGRVLRLIRKGDREIPIRDLVTELSVLSVDLRRCHREIVDLSERRDLSFMTQKNLRRLWEHSIWLYRKTHSERAFFQKLELENRLRALISQEAFNLHQELLTVDDDQRRFIESDDASVAAQLLADEEKLESI